MNIEQGLRALSTYDFGFLRERYVDEYPQYADRFNEAATELRKFFALPFYSNGPLAFRSRPIDALWHTFIQHTERYARFCEDVFGGFLHHRPNSTLDPVAPEAMGNNYLLFPKVSGAMGDMWFEDVPPAYQAALRMGEVPAGLLELKWSGWPGWK